MKNNYSIEFEKCTNKNNKTINIFELKWRNLKKEKKINLNINFELMNQKDYKKILKNFKKNKDKFMRKFKDTSNSMFYVYGFNPDKNQHTDFLNAIKAIMQPNKKEMYNYIYDTVCDYLDSFFYGKNLCDFIDNRCGEKRNTSCTTGCCHHFRIKCLGPLTKLVLCEHLKADYTCGAKCIGCKLFTCDYLRKKGVQFRIRDILLLDTFFNPIQKYFIRYKVFTPKEKIIKILLFWS